jgi:ribose-phosphate pyrophosphokinase
MVTLRCSTIEDLFRACLAANSIRHQLPDHDLGKTRISLFMPFLPHARQDRVASPGDALSLQVVMEMISNTFDALYTFDAHNTEAVSGWSMIDVYDLSPKRLHLEVVGRERWRWHRPVCIVFPDKGAAARYKGSITERPVISFDKKRDPETGELTFIEPEMGFDHVEGSTCIIIDDICDGGGTFIPVAKKLKEMGAGRVVLCVSHGIFSKGLMDMENAGIEHFYTTDSFPSKNGHDDRISTYINWNQLCDLP